MKKKVKKENYPKVLYVVKEDDGDDYYFIAEEGFDSFEDGEVAVYEFMEVRTKKTTTTLTLE